MEVQMEENVSELMQVLSLEMVDGPAPGGETHCFKAWNQKKPGGRLFGGQVLAQCVAATSQTMSEDRFIHSIHGYFLRAGRDDTDLFLGVENLRDGGSFSTRRVQAYQNGVPIFSAIASFQTEQEGLEHSNAFPDDIPGPEELQDLNEILGETNNGLIKNWIARRPFDIRPVDPELYTGFSGAKTSHTRYWLRAIAPLSTDRVINAATAAYASDYSLLESILRRHGLSWSDPRLRMASLDHAMWWHRPINLNEWHLIDYRSPAAEGGRGLGMGSIFTHSGDLVASVAQQGMVRVKETQ